MMISRVGARLAARRRFTKPFDRIYGGNDKEICFSLYCMGSWQCPRNLDGSVTITKVIACGNNPALSSPSMSLPSPSSSMLPFRAFFLPSPVGSDRCPPPSPSLLPSASFPLSPRRRHPPSLPPYISVVRPRRPSVLFLRFLPPPPQRLNQVQRLALTLGRPRPRRAPR